MKRRPYADDLRAALERLHVEVGYALDLLGLGVLDGVDQVLHHAREVEVARIAARSEALIEQHRRNPKEDPKPTGNRRRAQHGVRASSTGEWPSSESDVARTTAQPAAGARAAVSDPREGGPPASLGTANPDLPVGPEPAAAQRRPRRTPEAPARKARVGRSAGSEAALAPAAASGSGR